MESLFEQTKDLIHYVTTTIYFFRYQNYYLAYQGARSVVNMLQKYLVRLPEEGAKEFLPVLEIALEALEEQDGVRLADILEEGILPLLYQMQQILFEESDGLLEDCWGKNRRILKKRFPDLYRKMLECRENIPNQYQISWAKTGDLVLSVATEGQGIIPLNSMCNPWKEALLYAEHVAGAREFLVIGAGLGYHLEFLISQMACKKVVVLENDLRQLAIALSYRDLSHVLSNEKITFVHCEDEKAYRLYLREKTEDARVCIWYPSVRTIEDTALREWLENYKIELSSIENAGPELANNFQDNLEKDDREVSCLQSVFQNKKIIFVAGGPSLDNNLEYLKQRKREESILVCVGKVARKLISSGVQPDYLVMIDGQAKTRWQISGIEKCGVPLIYLSTVSSAIVGDYEGERYIAFQEGFPAAEQYAKEHGYPLYQSGGSVATFALDLLIRFGCRRVICVGLDMGYSGERTHAFGMGNCLADKSQLRKVEGVSSKYVYTSKTLDIYRKWIEKRIDGIKGIELINASNGARIHGMKELNLEAALED